MKVDVPASVGEHPVDAPIVCNLTRFGLRGARHLVPTYRDYQKVAQSTIAAQIPGLQRFAFLIESPTTCYSLSIWDDHDAIARFGTDVTDHVHAARSIFGRLAVDPERGPELWTTKWRLASVTNNLNWGDYDLRGRITAAGSREVAADGAT